MLFLSALQNAFLEETVVVGNALMGTVFVVYFLHPRKLLPFISHTRF